jgi:hypothetical protein
MQYLVELYGAFCEAGVAHLPCEADSARLAEDMVIDALQRGEWLDVSVHRLGEVRVNPISVTRVRASR